MENKYTRSVSLVDGHIEEQHGITNTKKVLLELKSVAEWFTKHGRNTNTAIIGICERAYEEINRQQAENERLQGKIKSLYKELERISLMTVATDEKEMTEVSE